MLLAATAIRGGQPFYTITTLAISFDEPIPAKTFQFEPSEGEQVQSLLGDFFRPRRMTPAEAQCCAIFNVLVPDRVPTDWQGHCTFREASPRPPFPAHVSLFYRSSDGHHSVSISQTAAADASQHYGAMIGDKSWQEVLRDGVLIQIRPADGGLPAQARLARYGTFAWVTSQSLTADQLATIAASLKPAPETSRA